MDASRGGISFGPFQLDLTRGELLRNGELVSLAPKPLALLSYLAANRDRAVPKAELRKQVWPGVFVSEAALASALKDLRRALGDDGARQGVIRTLRRRGYRFVARLREGAQPAGPAPAAPSEPTPRAAPRPQLVARGRELRALLSWLAQAARGRPRIVLLVGESGSGKTRLLEELAAHPACSGFAVGIGHGQAGAPLPYLGLAEALGARLFAGGDSAEDLLADDAAILRPLLQLDAPPRPAGGPGLDHAERDRADLFAAVTELVTRLARRRPTLLAVEDLHDADPASLDLFAALAAGLGAARAPVPLLLVATTRPAQPGERLGDVLRRIEPLAICSTLRVTGLGVGATRRLLGALGVERSSHAELRALQAATDGNPLFIRELARSGRGRISATDSRGAGDLRSLEAARVAALPDGCRRALAAAACLGERFGLLALSALCGADSETVRRELEPALRAGLVTGAERSFRFDHPLVREVVRDATPEPLARELHRGAAALLEDLYASAPGEHALEIAHHLLRGGSEIEPGRLRAFARRAGDQAAALCAWREAARFHAAAAAAAGALPLGERAGLELRAGLSANHDLDVESALEHYGRAADAFAEAGDDAGLAWALLAAARARSAFPAAASPGGVDVRPLEDLAARFGESHPGLRARIHAAVSEAHWVAGELEAALASAERAVAIARGQDDDALSHETLMGLGMAQLSLLRVREALESWLEAAARARRTRDPWLEATPGGRVALALLLLGRLPEARERARSAIELARAARHGAELGLAHAQLAALEAASGAFAEAESHAAKSLSALDRQGVPWAGLFAHSARAAAAAARGAFAEANAALDELVTPGRAFEKPGPAVQLVTAAYRELVAARRDGASADPRRAARLVGALRGVRLDPYQLGAVCALAEVSDSLRDRALAAVPEELLRAAAAAGIAFTPGWPFSVERALGCCARLAERWDEAGRWLDDAVARARDSGARVALAEALVDRARLSLERADARRAARDLDEALPLLEALAMRPALRDALALSRSVRRPS
ncbi:MAG TPA: AAA family ATPase [Myxococcota bacterium]|nr:AAA family ATPase [Myxococcota bacterium]